jgi:uracil-DNA glycosylase
VILGLASGFGLPEIASLTVFYVVVLEILVFRTVTAKVLWAVSYEAMAMIGAIFIIIFASTAMTNYMVTADVPKKLVVWTQAHVESKIVFLLAINGILLIVGTVMDIFSAIVVVLPLIAPIAKAYGIDPYHLGVIFLLNLEVGYLHPPVGLNLFISSVKFQRPITEVMWATIPFLVTMIVALLTITYIPALTVVPEPERRGTIANLAQLVHDSVEEGRSVKEVALVDADGKPLTGGDGKPLIRYLKDCAAIKSDTARDTCQTLFFDVSNCKTQPTPEASATCAHQKIAAWVVANQEDGKEILVVSELPLVNGEGAPVKDKAGAPIVRKLADCAKLEGSEQDECRELFVKASNCRISPPNGPGAAAADACVKEAVAAWVDEHAGHD